MNTDRLLDLLNKFKEEDLDEAEWNELETWYNELNDTHAGLKWTADDKAAIAEEMLSEFRRTYSTQAPLPSLPERRLLHWPKIAVAAAIAGLLLTGSYLFLGRNSKSLPELTARDSQQKRFRNDVDPGKHKATLILANGQQVVLDSTHGVISGTKDIRVQNKGGLLSYDGSSSGPPENPGYNIVSTAKGETYSVKLSDGTKVWLNSGSSLRFPVIFPGQERIVEVTGEAYFEVAKEINRPFLVKGPNDNFETEVLGTAFNVNSYEDEAALKVTLLEGSIRVRKNGKTALLKPGQQARMTSSSITVEDKVDTEQILAWKKGMFDFRNADIKEIMREAARWYDIEVEYKGSPSSERYKGIVSMDTKLSELLKILELTDVRFIIDGKKITVMY